MDAITFSLEELGKLDRKQLVILAKYYNLPFSGKREVLINRIDKHYRPISYIPVEDGEDLGQRLLPDETPDNPKYSTRIRRMYWLSRLVEEK